MFARFRTLVTKHSFFLFGPRGTGKTTLLKAHFSEESCLWLDLLDADLEEKLSARPHDLAAMVAARKSQVTTIVIDEVQKVPKLLDEVHRLIESTNLQFVLTGSSARKLKAGGANLLAGRAFVYHLHPLSAFELKDNFNMDEALHWGTLPKIFKMTSNEDKEAFLRAYTDTYLREEIAAEQIVRKLPPFRRFLEVSAHCNGKIITLTNIARDVGVDEKTVAEYFRILEDTMLGFFLEPFHNSFRKRLSEKPKFYFFDTGVVRSLSRRLSVPLARQTSGYGEAFEHFVILEVARLVSYFHPDYRLSYLRTPSDVEIDLIVERPGLPLLCIEIKSTDAIKEADIASFKRITQELPNCEAHVLSQDRFAKKYDNVLCRHWQEAIAELFL